MRIASSIVALLVLGGCAPAFDVAGVEWAKSGASIQQDTLEETECARAAFAAGWTPDLVLGGLLDVVRVVIQNGRQTGTYHDCMTKRGYRPRS